MMQHNLEEVLILEDDIRFEKNFRKKMQDFVDVIRRPNISWDLMSVHFLPHEN